MLTLNADIPNAHLIDRLMAQAPEILLDELRDGIERTVLVAEGEIASRTPVNKGEGGGNLRALQSSRVETGPGWVTGYVENSASYARFVEDDTKAHEIRAKNGKALRFAPLYGYRLRYSGGRALRGRAIYRVQSGKGAGKDTTTRRDSTFLYRRRVWHPGTTGQHMFRDGTAATAPRMRVIMGNRIHRAMRRMTGRA